MSVYKCTLLFQDQTGPGAGGPSGNGHIGGWSESYYSGAPDINDLRNRLFGPIAGLVGLCPARAGILPASASIVGVRVSLVLPKSGSSQTLGNTFPGSSIWETDVPQMALQATMPSTNTVNIRRQALRGVPDSQVTFGEYNPSVPYAQQVAIFFNELSIWRFVGQDFTFLPQDILSIDAGGIVSLVGLNTYVVGDVIQIKGTVLAIPLGKYSYKRTVASVGPAANQFKLNNSTGLVTTGGTARKVEYLSFLIDSTACAVNRITVRKVGRPFGAYRGRRSKRKVL